MELAADQSTGSSAKKKKVRGSKNQYSTESSQILWPKAVILLEAMELAADQSTEISLRTKTFSSSTPAEERSQWQTLDQTLMGHNSSSALQKLNGSTASTLCLAVWLRILSFLRLLKSVEQTLERHAMKLKSLTVALCQINPLYNRDFSSVFALFVFLHVSFLC